MPHKHFIWTNHARIRLKERKIPQAFINKALNYPDRIIHKDGGVTELQKRIEYKTVAAIIKTNEKGEKLIVSCWINPPYPGTKDFKRRSRYFESRKAGIWKKLWLFILNKIGL